VADSAPSQRPSPQNPLAVGATHASPVRPTACPSGGLAEAQTAFLPAPVQITKRQAGPRPRTAFSGAPVQNTKLCVYGDLTVSYPPDRPEEPHFQGRQPRSPDRQRPPGGRLAVWSLVFWIFRPKTLLPVPAPFAAPNVSLATVLRPHLSERRHDKACCGGPGRVVRYEGLPGRSTVRRSRFGDVGD
jgi:hypothetical protein